jgi:hypothetical protein
MRPIIEAAICALAAAAVGAPAFAASADYYLKLGPVKGDSARSGGQLEILSWTWGAAGAAKYGAVAGAHRDDSADGGADVTAARVNLNSSKSNISREIAVSDPGADGPKTKSKRQHGWVTVSKPLDRGALRVKVKLPWLGCKVGAAFPDAVLQNDAGRYEFEDG